MILDCQNLLCPEPVIKTKQTLEKLNVGDELEILVNSLASLENIKRFLSTLNMKFTIQTNENFTSIKTSKICKISPIIQDFECENFPKFSNKILYLNDNKAGSGDVGTTLLNKFLSSICNLDKLPKMIICVNNAVKITANRGDPNHQAMKNLQNLGIKIYSCGTCLSAYNLTDKLEIGEISNAFEIMQFLMDNEVVKL